MRERTRWGSAAGTRGRRGSAPGCAPAATPGRGWPGRARRLARALRSVGSSGARLAGQRALAPRFLTSAGDAAEGWLFAASFLDPTRVTAAKSFVTAYRARFDTAPPWYSVEAYDATLFVARAMTALGTSRPQRDAIVGQLRETDYRGITKRLHYDSSASRYPDAMSLFRAPGGVFCCLGDYRDATTGASLFTCAGRGRPA